uniref:Letm1 RBD domain-containing protein n=1 Tax=Lotharella globosa TaxID=91324 RepID=A0A6V3P2G2_9EUKA
MADIADEDELTVLESQVLSFKERLGLANTNLQVDFSSVRKAWKDTVTKLRMALSFYVLGTKLLGNDIQYALWLIARAIDGDTLKPREARMLQRTAKDLLTLLPFTIILLIPLTPVGHVLVFSAIQKFFPDFYPSPYTERRQNLVRLYQEIEQKL